MQSRDDQSSIRACALPDLATLLNTRIAWLETELAKARDVASHAQSQWVAGEKELVKLREALAYQQALAVESQRVYERKIAAITAMFERSRGETAALRVQLQAQDTAFFGAPAEPTKLTVPDRQPSRAMREKTSNDRDSEGIWTGEEFAQLFPPPPPGIIYETIDKTLKVTSSLAAGQHVYVYTDNFFSLTELDLKDQIKFHLSTTNGLNIQIVILFFNAQKERIGHTKKTRNENQTEAIPADAVWLKVGLRFAQSGMASIKEFRFGHLPDKLGCLASEPFPVSVANLKEIFQTGGAGDVIQVIAKHAAGKPGIIACDLLKSGKLLAQEGFKDAEYPLALAAVDYERSESIFYNLYWAALRAQAFEMACAAIIELEQFAGPNPSESQADTLHKLKSSPTYLLSILKLIEPKHPSRLDSIPRRICYILHNSLPYSSGGYGTRSHGVAGGLKEAGCDVVVLTRPGFPVDIKTELSPGDVPLRDEIAGITYVRTLEPLRSSISTLDYMIQAADALETRLREYRPELVISASNHITGLPALIAARRLGIPFIYEVRGLWEITRMSRDHAFAEKPAFAVQKILEASVARHADHVFTLTEPMREELVERGVEPEKIDLLPNSCDPTRFLPRQRDEALAERLGIPAGVPVIGYIGTFVDYEGLEDLASACALLKARDIAFRLLLVGNENASGQDRGPITEEIARIAEEHAFSDWLIMPGRVPHEEVESYYSLIDVAPFPRKPWPVCEMVSPMKPLEALAMEKAVVVSSVRALVEMIAHEQTGLVFDKGDNESLAATLQRLIAAPDLRRQLGIQGRKWVEQERTWRQVGGKAVTLINRVVATRKKSKKKVAQPVRHKRSIRFPVFISKYVIQK